MAYGVRRNDCGGLWRLWRVAHAAAFDEERLPLGAVFGDRFSLTAPSLDIDECRLVAGGAGFVFELAVDREAELTNGGALRRDPELGIARQVPQKDYFVE